MAREYKKVTRKVKSDNNRDIEPLQPLNEKQQEYIEALYRDSVIIATGVLGSSKTYCPSVIAADLLMNKQVDKVVIARPNSSVGKSIGYLPGTLDEKLDPWCEPITSVMKKRMGQGNYDALVSNGRISMVALEHTRGKTFDNCFVIVDEAQNLEVDVAKALVTRQGVNCTMVITGDIAQKDIKQYSGLQLLLEVSERYNLPVTLVSFDSWDYCVRSTEARQWGQAFEDYDRGG